MAEDATASALSDMTPQPVANPDAQTTVNDFLDYTEFFPSDLLRSLRLIGDLDATYLDATLHVHDLTKTYGRLPNLPAHERPDPVALRKQIATALDKAIYCRESTYAEASRLYEVAERHTRRLAIIKTKLQALPQPPSRDPTPAPISPQVARSAHRPYDRVPRLHLHFDASRHGASTIARPRDRKSLHRRRSTLSSDSSSDSDVPVGRSRVKIPNKERAPRPPRPRPAGSGASRPHVGISTSHALALLSPPPPDAKPGSKFAPWFKLTEYEMAVLRKHMKKNAQWTPSDTMIRRELDKKQRGHEFYEKEKARCEATGEEFLDEEPHKPSSAAIPPPESYVPVVPVAPVVPVVNRAESIHTDVPVVEVPETVVTPIEPPSEVVKEDEEAIIDGWQQKEAKEANKVRRESQREQAIHSGQKLEDAARKIQEGAENLKELIFNSESVHVTPLSTRRASVARVNNKRKRDSSPSILTETSFAITREASLASQDSATKPPNAKRLRPSASSATAPALAHGRESYTPPLEELELLLSRRGIQAPDLSVPVDLPNEPPTKSTTTQIPLAPEGPSTPKVTDRPTTRASNIGETPGSPTPIGKDNASPTPMVREDTAPAKLVESDVSAEPTEPTEPEPPATAATVSVNPPPSATTATAASTRPRRESLAPTKVASPPPVPAQPVKTRKTPTPAPEPLHSSPAPTTRPRSSRGHVPTPKAQSEEPKPNDLAKSTRELRRHSIFSQSAVAAPTRVSTRKKPPPKGDVTSASDGPKTVSNKRSQGSKNKRKKKPDEAPEPFEDIDPNEPRYCVCDDVSYGEMIQCDNNCERQWFHFDCVGMTDASLPSRRGKWYCPDCRKAKNVNAYGNPAVEEAPAASGRRGNR